MSTLYISELSDPKWADHNIIMAIEESREEMDHPIEGEGGQILAIDADGERITGDPVDYWTKDQDITKAFLEQMFKDYPDATHLVLEAEERIEDPELGDGTHPTGYWSECVVYPT